MDLMKKMRQIYPKEIMALLKRIGALSSRSGYNAFAVGGLVRDLILGSKNLDLDIVIEGDAINFARTLARDLKGALIVHKRFGTAAVVTGTRLKIDLATARKEVYERPAALPTVVEFSSLKDDLVRRDFTINAMAISLNRDNFGQLIDFFGGEADLAHGRIRVMHDASFIDDPTRIFRAVRFEQRFGFVIDKHTVGLIMNAMKEKMFYEIQPHRIRDEIILILKEKEPIRALVRMAELHELRFIHPKLTMNRRFQEFYKSIDEACSWYERSSFKKRALDKWLIYLIALFDGLSYEDVVGLCDRFAFRRGERLRMLSYKRYGRKISKALSSKRLKPSEIYGMLEPLSYEAILLIMAKSRSRTVRPRIMDFFKKYNGMKTKIKGDDIRALGLKPGPRFKKILKRVLDKALDGDLNTRTDQLEYVKRLVRR